MVLFFLLTRVLVKSLERLIHHHIMSFLSDNKLLFDMHGFRPLRSYVTQLLQLERARAPKERRKTSLVDVRLAFDVFCGNKSTTETKHLHPPHLVNQQRSLDKVH